MGVQQDYRQWLERRRSICPSDELTDRIMQSVLQRQRRYPLAILLRVGLAIQRSRIARWAACLVAFLVGTSPFVYIAHVAQLLVF